MRLKAILVLVVGSFAFVYNVNGQSLDSATAKLVSFPSRLMSRIQSKATDLNQQMMKQTQLYLQKMAREEDRLRRQLEKKDTAAARRIFGNSAASYQAIQQKLHQLQQRGDSANVLSKAYSNVYSGHLDSLKTALGFLQSNNLSSSGSLPPDLQTKFASSIGSLNQLQTSMNASQTVQTFMASRQAALQQQLGSLGMAGKLTQLKTTAYYYQAQVAQYKNSLEDPSKVESEALQILSNNAAFRNFFNQHSELGSLFSLPGAGSTGSAPASLQGLQTKQVTTADLMEKFGKVPNPPQIMQQQGSGSGAGSAGGGVAAQVSQWKEKLSSLGSGSTGNGQPAIPNFTPNDQKTKTFLKRLEYGFNVQTTKSSSLFPVTSNFALTLGYKINSGNTVGIGASYLMGWGSDIHHIGLSSQGMGFRTFADIRLKGSLYVSGGGELNYESVFNSLKILNNYSAWQKSLLLGLTKKYSVGKNLNGNIQLLYDFLYRSEIPNNQPFVFRIGYSLK
jgi:hypothetical protein